MGGYGSGRTGWRVSCENCLSIDVRRLAREKLLADGTWFNWRWNNEANSTISVRVEGDYVNFSYSVDGEPQTQRVGLARTRCHFGNHRKWFWCPCCTRRSANLYFRSGRFACRRCNRLAYLIENQDYGQRQWMKAERIERRLGPEMERPKGMHQSTYRALLDRYNTIHQARDVWFDVRLLRWLPYLDSL
jgi:hypothetical protein